MRTALILGCIGAAVAALGALVDPRAFFVTYLSAVVGWSALPIGCLALLMMTHLVRGRWSALLGPALEAGAATLPLTALLFLPILVGIPWIYPWAEGHVDGDVPGFKAAYLSPAFFTLRTVIAFAVLSALAWALQRADSEEVRRKISSGGMILYALIASFAGIDWAESIEPKFHSSIFGLIIVAHQLLAGVAFALLASLPRASARAPSEAGLGGLLLSALLLWAYLQAMQFIVIWSADLPEEVVWYLRRGSGFWGALLWILAVGQGLLPFLALLLGAVRRSASGLLILAFLTFLMRLAEPAWLILPPAELHGVWPVVTALASLVAIGGFWTAAFLRKLIHVERPSDERVAEPA